MHAVVYSWLCEAFSSFSPHYGFPLAIVSYRGSQWISELFRDLCDMAGVQLSLSTAFQLSTNGLTEHTKEVVTVALHHYVTADVYATGIHSCVLLSYRSSHHDAIGTTPFKMNRITIPANHFDVWLRDSQ